MDDKELIRKSYTGDILDIFNEIEIKMIELILKFIDFKDRGISQTKFKSIEDINYDFASKICFYLGIINEDLFKNLKGFKSGRNKFAHRKFSWYLVNIESSKIKIEGGVLFKLGSKILMKLEIIEKDLDKKREELKKI